MQVLLCRLAIASTLLAGASTALLERDARADPAVSGGPSIASPPPDSLRSGERDDVRLTVPSYAYAYSAYGATARTVGAQAYGLGVAASGQRSIVGGGLTVWGSPVDRLTLIGDAQRDSFGNFTPSAGLIVRIFGRADAGFSLGAISKYKVEGFAGARPGGHGTAAANPAEIEGEIETGLLLSYTGARGIHVDLNAITGMGTGDDGEVDAEGRARFGYDVSSVVRVGADAQARVRLNGPRYLPNGTTWDFSAGPQVIVGSKSFFGSLTAGPTTNGLLSRSVGGSVIASVGGTTF